MAKVRHYLFLAIGLLAVGVLVSWLAAFWTALVLILSFGVRALAALIAAIDRYGKNPWTLRLLLLFPILSMALALAGSIMIGIRFGWPAGIACPVLYIIYFSVRR